MNLLQFLNNAVGGPPQHGRSDRCNEVSRYYDPTPHASLPCRRR